MTWAYLLIYNEKLETKRVTDLIDDNSEITHWVRCLPRSLFLTSTLSAGQISDLIYAEFGSEAGQRWFITEVHKDRQGWLPRSVWYMLNHPDDPVDDSVTDR
jgi:hypothetical protein